MTRQAATVLLAGALALGGCASDSTELVVRDATMGAGVPTVVGAADGVMFWSVGNGPAKLVAGASLADLPGKPKTIGMTTGAALSASDHVVFAGADGIMRADLDMEPTKYITGTADALAERLDPGMPRPTVAWTTGDKLSWGLREAEKTAELTNIKSTRDLRITATSIYVDALGTSEPRLLRVERATGKVTVATSSNRLAGSFPGGAHDGAIYRGRLVGADDAGAYWLVEESTTGATTPSRAILVTVPESGEPVVVLDHLAAVGGFFVTPDAFYWQESDALLSAPRSGGSASIVADLPGTASAVADGFAYFTEGSAIKRFPVD